MRPLTVFYSAIGLPKLTLAFFGLTGLNKGLVCSYNNHFSLLIAAQSSLDYIGISLTITISADDNDTGCQNITIIDDNVLESEEYFNVTITTSNPNVVLENEVTVVSIADDEGL